MSPDDWPGKFRRPCPICGTPLILDRDDDAAASSHLLVTHQVKAVERQTGIPIDAVVITGRGSTLHRFATGWTPAGCVGLQSLTSGRRAVVPFSSVKWDGVTYWTTSGVGQTRVYSHPGRQEREGRPRP